MAAGLGFKTFTTGEVLTAADVNGYLMQGVLVFASEAARNSAITSPQEGQFAFTKDTNSLWYYSGSAWVASGATGDIEGVTAGTGISGGGTSGTVTITNSMATEITAKADLIVGTGNAAFDNLAVGANGTVLTADSTVSPTGLKWAAPAGGGSLIYITSSSFSGSSAVNVNDCFSATYKNYLINIENTELASGSDIRLRARLRVGGSDNTTSNYQESRQGRTWYGSPATFESSTSNGDGWFFWGNFETTTGADATRGAINTTVTLYQPFATAFTGYNLLAQTSDASQRAGGKFAATTSFTGFTIFPGSSTITGTVKVYGIKDS
jgi:hypothetical protein